MAYYNDPNNDRTNYEKWHRYGRDRGFFDRATDEIRSWFGDENAENRRRRDLAPENRGGRRQKANARPEWQDRYYSGPSPRGGNFDERGRYGVPYRGEYSRSRHWGYPGTGAETGGGRYESEYEPSGNWSGQRTEDASGQRDLSRQTQEEVQNRRLRNWFEDHTGRGPRGYQRSDERILDVINENLTLHPEIDASDIDATVDSGIVTLRGTVDCRRSKSLAEDIAEDAYGVKEVHNELHIARRSASQPDYSSRGVLSR